MTSPLPNPDVKELVARAQKGDRAALEEVLASVAPAIHRFGLRMCKNSHDADDVVQDTLINVVHHLDEFEGRSSLTSWVFTLARTACSRKRRGLKNRPPVSDERVGEEADAAPSPEANTESRELALALTRAMDELSDEYQEVIQLRDVEGLSAPEAAEILGVSVDALKSRLHRAREALRRSLRPLLEPNAAAPSSTCPDVALMWSRKLEDDLSTTDCASMEKHIAGCPSCGAACDALKQALLACQRSRTNVVPPEVQQRVKAAVRAWAGTI